MASAFYKNSKIFDPNKWIYFIPVLIMVGLIYKQPNLSMVILLFATPAIIPMILFDKTKTIFDKWLSSIIGFMFYTMFFIISISHLQKFLFLYFFWYHFLNL